jgi:hypothetical protein
MRTFDEAWRDTRLCLFQGLELPNWSYDGRARGITRIDQVYFDEIMVSARGTVGSRSVRKTDFKKVYEFWERYKQGQISRDELQKISRNTTYIFSILHWLEASQEIAP